MKSKYVCPKGCRLSKSGIVLERKGGRQLLCREHRLHIECKEIVCIDCKSPVQIGLQVSGKVRCDPCQAIRRFEKMKAYKRTDKSKKVERTRRRAISAVKKLDRENVNLVNKLPEKETSTRKARTWPGKRAIRNSECKMYERCLDLVPGSMSTSKMNCGVCAGFTLRSDDAADWVTGEVCGRSISGNELGTYEMATNR
jgi:hypothetical protein